MKDSFRVILHIGPHKTGTTYIQRNLLDNRAALAKVGVIYPEVFCEKPGHHALYRAVLRSPRTIATDLEALLQQLRKQGQTAIFSSETLSHLGETEMGVLRAALSPVPVQTVMYLRARGPVIWSQWQEDVKHGETRSFSEYVTDLMLRTPEAKSINPLGLAVRSQRALGSLKLVDYEACVASGIDLIEPLLQLAADGPILLPHLNTYRVNSRMPQERVEVLRLLNLIAYRRLKRHPGILVRKLFLTALRNSAEVREATAEVGTLIGSQLVELPLDLLDEYFWPRDEGHTAFLQAAGVEVPPFGVLRETKGLDRTGFKYLPDISFLLSPLLPAVIEIYDMLDIQR